MQKIVGQFQARETNTYSIELFGTKALVQHVEARLRNVDLRVLWMATQQMADRSELIRKSCARKPSV
jgi:hypothetical protein